MIAKVKWLGRLIERNDGRRGMESTLASWKSLYALCLRVDPKTWEEFEIVAALHETRALDRVVVEALCGSREHHRATRNAIKRAKRAGKAAKETEVAR